MPKLITLNTWSRRPQYEFFKVFDNPFFNICADVDVTAVQRLAKQNDISFFLASLYLSLHAANGIDEFRQRIHPEGVVEYEAVDAGSTILNDDASFGFCYFDYAADFQTFYKKAKAALAAYHAAPKQFDPQDQRDDLLHYSVIPWVSFTSFSHARRFKTGDSIPKIVLGRFRQEQQQVKMPVSVDVHHALMDGLHMGEFFQDFQALLVDPAAILL